MLCKSLRPRGPKEVRRLAVQKCITNGAGVTIGLDLGDKWSHYFVLNPDGTLGGNGRVATTRKALRGHFEALRPARVALEVGTHSRWISALLEECGHEV